MVKKKFWQERGNGQFLGWGEMMVSMTPRFGLSGFYMYCQWAAKNIDRDGTKLHGSSAIGEWSCLPSRPAFDQSAP